MVHRLRHWLNRLPIHEMVERQQALLLQAIILVLMGISALLVGQALVDTSVPEGGVARIVLALVRLGALASALLLLRRGRFLAALLIVALSLQLSLTAILLVYGVRAIGILSAGYTLPLVLVGLLADRRTLLLIAGLTIAQIWLLVMLAQAVPELSRQAPDTFDQLPLQLLVTTVVTLTLSAILALTGGSLRSALAHARARELELQALRDAQEQLIDARTADLSEAIEAMRHHESTLEATLAELHASQEAFRELSAPIIPVLPGVLVAPLVGALDDARAGQLSENLLRAVEQRRAHHVVIDISGVPLVDTQVAGGLIRVASAARLLGAQASLVGVRPEVAQSIVGLGVELQSIASYATLEQAVAELLLRRRDGQPAA